MKLIEAVNQFISEPSFGVKILWVPSDEYIDFAKNRSKYLLPGMTLLDYGYKSEFEENRIYDLLKEFKIELKDLNHRIVKYTLKEEDKICDLFPKTRFQVNLFIVLQKYDFVVLPLAAFSEDTINELIAKWQEGYPQKKILAIDSSVSNDSSSFQLIKN